MCVAPTQVSFVVLRRDYSTMRVFSSPASSFMSDCPSISASKFPKTGDSARRRVATDSARRRFESKIYRSSSIHQPSTGCTRLHPHPKSNDGTLHLTLHIRKPQYFWPDS